MLLPHFLENKKTLAMQKRRNIHKNVFALYDSDRMAVVDRCEGLGETIQWLSSVEVVFS